MTSADPALEAARDAQRAAVEAIRPKARTGPRYDLGDGDRCPVIPSHGRMFCLPQGNPRSQWCPNEEHAGRPGRPETRTRANWPFHDFDAAAKAYHLSTAGEAVPTALPDLDLGGLDA